MGEGKKYPKYFIQFLNELQIKLVRSLKRRSSIKKGSLTISTQVEKYLIKNYGISNRMQSSNFLDRFKLDKNIIKDHLDTEPGSIFNFTMRIGRKSVYSYITLATSGPEERKLIPNKTLHWRFLREVQMNENGESVLNARYEIALQEQRAIN